MTTDDVFREFTRNLVSEGEPWPDTVPRQTLRVKEALHKVGDALESSGKCAPCYSAPLYSEFMVDFCCMDRESHEMLLAAESEWNLNPEKVIDDDFQKLVYLRSRFRILIFKANEMEILRRAVEFLDRYPNHFAGDSYIFVKIDWDGKTIRGWRISVEANSQIVPPVEIRQ